MPRYNRYNQHRMTLNTVGFEPTVFNPIEFKPVEADYNILNKSMALQEARQREAQEKTTAVDTALGEIEMNLHNDPETNQWWSDYKNNIKNTIATAANVGDYASAINIATQQAGKITSDTNPYKESKEKELNNDKTKRTTMSFLTALSLSFNNLMTKKGRTILVSLAGSIGIIGIALIMSLSTGFQNYIDKIQEDTLSSYPLTIYQENADMTQMLLSMMGSREDDTMEGNKVYERQFVSSMFGNVSKNDLKNFKIYLEKNYKSVENDISSIKYSYSISPLIYSKLNNDIYKLNPNSMMDMAGLGSSTIYSQYSNIYFEMQDDINLGKYIADRRKQLHLTQEELGSRIGVSKSAVAKWETNRGLPDRDNLKRLSDVLNISTDEIHRIIENVGPEDIDLNINITL